MVDRRAEFGGPRQPAAPAGRDIQPGVPRPHRAAAAGGQPRQADRGQSANRGALTFAFLSRGRDRQLQFTYQVSAGNQTVLEAHDYIDWVLDAGGADIFMCYLEGIRDPARFRAVADKAARAGKPLIVAKVGRSDAGRRAAASHTGALAHAGCGRRRDLPPSRHHPRRGPRPHGRCRDRLRLLQAAASGNRVAIITGSGGSAVWMADILSAHGLELPVLEDDIQRQIMAMLPSYASALNPIDATAQAIGEVGYAPMVELVRQSRAHRHDPADQLAGQREHARKKMAEELAADHRDARQADPAVRPTRPPRPAAIAAFAARRHPLLHLDAELRPRDPGAGRLRPRSASASPAAPPRPRAAGQRDEVARGAARCPARC